MNRKNINHGSARHLKEIEEQIKAVNYVIEVLDARAPQSSSNPALGKIIGKIQKIIVLNKSDLADPDVYKRQGEKQLVVTEAIINSMTRSERVNPHMINSSRRKRIAMGSGTNVQDVNRLLKQFEQMKKMMKRLGAMEKKGFKKFKRNKGFPFM